MTVNGPYSRGGNARIAGLAWGWLAIFMVVFCHTAQASRTVTDRLGRTIVVPDAPKRIVSLAPSITEIMFALDKGHLLKGATQFSDYPEAAKTLPAVGSYIRLDVEKIAALQPDLCIAVKDGNPKFVIDKLTTLGIPVYAVDPRNLESVIGSVREIGELCGASAQARSVVADMEARIGFVRERISHAATTPRVFFQIGISPIVSVGTRTFLHELIVMAGGENVTRGPIPYPRYSKEQVLALAPDIMIITSMARGGVFEKVKREWGIWTDLPAVKNDRILLVDSDILDRASPRLVDGFELLARLIHPELFPVKKGDTLQ